MHTIGEESSLTVRKLDPEPCLADSAQFVIAPDERSGRNGDVCLYGWGNDRGNRIQPIVRFEAARDLQEKFALGSRNLQCVRE